MQFFFSNFSFPFFFFFLEIPFLPESKENLEKYFDFFKDDDSFSEDNFRDLDPSVDYYPSPYCDIVDNFELHCLEHSILELWAVNGKYSTESERKTIMHLAWSIF